jgi:hypothetical protein
MNNALELNQHGLVELNSTELTELEGGIVWAPFAIAAGFIISAMNNWSDIEEGWADGAPGGKPRH